MEFINHVLAAVKHAVLAAIGFAVWVLWTLLRLTVILLLVALLSVENDLYTMGRKALVAGNNPLFGRMPDLPERPYSPDSPWNRPVAPHPNYDPRSDEMIATLGRSINGGRIYSDTVRFTFTLYFADGSTPRYNVPCNRFRCTIIDQAGSSERVPVLNRVPIPLGAQPSPGDELMIVIDIENNLEYGLFHPELSRRGWEAANAYQYPLDADGAPVGFHSRAAGVPYYAGLIRPWEIRAGEINHAIAFAYPYPNDRACIYPATRAVDTVTMEHAIPLGARIQLNPNLTGEDFERWGLTRAGRIVARALQEYGMILVDNSGAPKIYAEDLANNPFRLESWADPDLFYTRDLIATIPYTEFRVLELPDAFWDEDAEMALYGKCLIEPALVEAR